MQNSQWKDMFSVIGYDSLRYYRSAKKLLALMRDYELGERTFGSYAKHASLIFSDVALIQSLFYGEHKKEGSPKKIHAYMHAKFRSHLRERNVTGGAGSQGFSFFS